MAKKEKVEALVEGGKASAAPPLGPALGPLKVNMGAVISEINKKTEVFKGMKVPVKVIVDSDTKEFTIEVGTPPTSQLIKKEVNAEKGSGTPNKLKVGNIGIEQAIKVAKMKESSSLANNLTNNIKEVIGCANSLGVLVESKTSAELTREINAGNFDKMINSELTDVPKEKLDQLAKDLVRVNEEIKKKEEKLKAMEAEFEKEAAATVVAKAPAAAEGEAAKAEAGKKVEGAKEAAAPATAGKEAKPAEKKAPEKKK